LFALSIAVLFTVAPVQAREQGIQILAKAKKSQPLSNAGETGSEMKQLLYSLSQFGALAGFAVIAWIYQSFKEMKEKKMFTTEVEKIKEAKIEMYFDAVSEILSKLDDPKAKGSMKATLLKELKVLDPDGTMVKFLKGKGPKPDIWDRINTPKKKSAKPLKRRKKKKPQSAQASENTATSDSTMRNDNNTPRPAETQAEGAESSVFRDLLSSLKRSMPEDSANKIVQYLQTRMGGISDEAKRTTALSKIAARIDDKDYWVDLGGKIGAL
jgi:hypothetical protein